MSVITRLRWTGFLLAIFFCALPSVTMASSIAPEAFDLSLSSGDEESYQVLISNSGSSMVNYSVEEIRVEIDPLSGGINIANATGYENWLEFSEASFPLNAGEQKEITVRVRVPESARSETATLGIKISELPMSTEGIQVTKEFISLLFLTVEGDVTSSFEVIDFETDTSIVSEWPLSVFLSVKNTGDRVLQPSGTVELVDIFGKTVAMQQLNVSANRVLSGTNRTFTTELSGDGRWLLPGVYTVRLQATAWPHGDEITQELTIIYFTWEKLLMCALVFSALLLILIKTIASRRR